MTSIISNVEVHRTSSHMISLSWETKEARYHIWLERELETVYKNSFANHNEPGYFQPRKLDPMAKANQVMIALAMLEANQRGLIEAANKAFQDKEDAEQRERDRCIAGRLRTKKLLLDMEARAKSGYQTLLTVEQTKDLIEFAGQELINNEYLKIED